MTVVIMDSIGQVTLEHVKEFTCCNGDVFVTYIDDTESRIIGAGIVSAII